MNDWNKHEFSEAVEAQKTFCFYLYTPLCGTCQVASKMLGVIETLLPRLLLGKANLNYTKEIAGAYKIESVPCLLTFKEGKLIQKTYAFHSVTHLYEDLRKLA
ncbi:thioredoxin family protein [Peribacillus kribbensis]|uniref:thioredoxin family protein n=1 Tax=Peribacillus kribbensis TaxID=356658 RepID=UPI00042222CE|nr:thioredoxin family protein [Peribacillus kribbensis]